MTPSPQTNFLYLADCLPKKHPAFYQHFTTALNQQDIPFALLPGTKDIWAVDYMPIQTAINRFIRFTYNPSYLQSKKYQSTISDTDSICKAIQIETITSTIILDGGNLIRSNNKAILTNRIFSENPAMDKQQLIRELQELLSIENIYIIPAQPYDFTGHADGMVRFLNEHTLLINDYSQESQSFQKAFNKAIEQTGLETVKIPNEVYHNKSKHQANGCYINYLHINNRIFLPIYNTRHMQTNNYQETIKEALQTLIGVNDSIFNSIVNISMQGELKEFNDSVPIGETHQLDFEIFKNSSDTNIQLLIQLMSKVEETFDTIANINGIEIEEGE